MSSTDFGNKTAVHIFIGTTQTSCCVNYVASIDFEVRTIGYIKIRYGDK